jgi:hypothetical protein
MGYCLVCKGPSGGTGGTVCDNCYGPTFGMQRAGPPGYYDKPKPTPQGVKIPDKSGGDKSFMCVVCLNLVEKEGSLLCSKCDSKFEANIDQFAEAHNVKPVRMKKTRSSGKSKGKKKKQRIIYQTDSELKHYEQ